MHPWEKVSKTRLGTGALALYKFHMGWKSNMVRASGPWQCVVENTRLGCHLLLSNIIGLEGLMLRTGDAASDNWTHECKRGVAEHRELINRSGSCDQTQDIVQNNFQISNYTNLFIE